MKKKPDLFVIFIIVALSIMLAAGLMLWFTEDRDPYRGIERTEEVIVYEESNSNYSSGR